MKIQASSHTFAGLIATCPHCFFWAFPATIEAHMVQCNNKQLKEIYVTVYSEIQRYVVACKESGDPISLYGQDLASLFKKAKIEMVSRKLLKAS